MTHRITDIWFRSSLSLVDIATQLGLSEVTQDAENHWEWVIGGFGGMQLDITRACHKRHLETETRIFLLEGVEFSDELVIELADRLAAFIFSPIKCGWWEYISGNDFVLHVVREFPWAGALPE